MPRNTRAEIESARIRAELRRLPHARQCEHCTVITQGGNKGLGQHMQRCHPGVNYVYGQPTTQGS